jgi:hypothetical protein
VRGVATLAFAGLVACGPAQPSTTTTTPTTPAPTLDQMVDAMCACKTPACADGVKSQYPGLDKPADTTPHLIALHDALVACDTTAREGDEVGMLDKMEDAMCACKDAACADRVQHEYKAFWKHEEDKYSGDKRPTDQIMKIAEHLVMCEMSARDASDTTAHHGTGLDHTGGDWHPAPPPGGDSSGAGATGVATCDQYLREVDKIMRCDKVPQATKDAIKQGVDAMMQSFANMSDAPEEAKRAAADACTQARDAIDQAGSALGCSM